MKPEINKNLTRRTFIKTSALAAATLGFAPSIISCSSRKTDLLKRSFGKLNHDVTTFGLGGQASLQWTPDDIKNPENIILKAFDKGVNYFDTSNLYGPSQLYFNKAFQSLELIPGNSGYNEKLRRSIFLTSKTHLRFAKGGWEKEGLNNWSNGGPSSHTIDDLKRTLSQVFGDGKGNYPEGAYLDMVLIHSLSNDPEVDAVYEGLYNTDPKAENIGALAALRDFRDGTNLTGLNPKEERLIKHIGFSGHYNAGVMMDMIRRDKEDLLEGMLVAINANDKLNFNMQHNIIPVAKAKNMGMIGMKVFADGAMYSKNADWSRTSSDVVREVGSKDLPFSPLIKYSLTTPGISTLIIGIGQISDEASKCQLSQNISAAQITPDGLSETDREDVEKMTGKVKEGKTNYFQIDDNGLTAPTDLKANTISSGSVQITWNTAYAGSEPIARYDVYSGNEKLGEVEHLPQTTDKPFEFEHAMNTENKNGFKVVTVDKKGNEAPSEEIII